MLTLNLSGRGFTNNSLVQWNGSVTGVTNVQVDVSAQTISAQISAGLLANPGAISISVLDSTHSPSVTNALTLTLTGSLPVLTSVQPSQLNAGAGDTLVTVTGTHFSPAGFITFNDATNRSDFQFREQCRHTSYRDPFAHAASVWRQFQNRRDQSSPWRRAGSL
jgi:hypothetical protein